MTHWGTRDARSNRGMELISQPASAVRKETGRGPNDHGRNAMLTKDIISGFNILSLAGFVVMGLTLVLSRSGQTGKALSIGLMCAGTSLVFYRLYVGGW
jgi:hypothetical protein